MTEVAAQSVIRFRIGSEDLDFTDTDKLIPDVESPLTPLTPAVKQQETLQLANGTPQIPLVSQQQTGVGSPTLKSDSAGTTCIHKKSDYRKSYQCNNACDVLGGRETSVSNGQENISLQTIVIENCSEKEAVPLAKPSASDNLNPASRKSSSSKWNELFIKVAKEMKPNSKKSSQEPLRDDEESGHSSKVKKGSRLSKHRLSVSSTQTAECSEDAESKRQHR